MKSGTKGAIVLLASALLAATLFCVPTCERSSTTIYVDYSTGRRRVEQRVSGRLVESRTESTTFSALLPREYLESCREDWHVAARKSDAYGSPRVAYPGARVDGLYSEVVMAADLCSATNGEKEIAAMAALAHVRDCMWKKPTARPGRMLCNASGLSLEDYDGTVVWTLAPGR